MGSSRSRDWPPVGIFCVGCEVLAFILIIVGGFLASVTFLVLTGLLVAGIGLGVGAMVRDK